jgi:two-component system phosphate regulon sensor histidine kinase PhoR
MNIKKILTTNQYIILILLVEIISILTLINTDTSLPVLIFVFLTYVVILLLFITHNIHSQKILAGYFRKYASGIKSDDETIMLNNYEEKISKVNEIIEDMKSTYNEYVNIRGFSELYESFNTATKRLLDELNAAKIFKVNRNEFLGNVAHELRTPIFAIQLSLETLKDGAINDQDVNTQFLEKAFRQSNRLKELVDDLINISRLEAGMKLSKRYFSINNLIRETINELSGIVSNKNITLILDNEISDNIQVFADSERIKQVLINLIDNSVKYTLEKGSITIKTKGSDKSVLISVEDTGLGIPKEDLPRIFERFYRVDKTRSRDMGGSGLGLSIVKHILELHNSQIKVESETDKGTKFEFNLPS